MNSIITNVVRFLLFAFFQVFVLNKVPPLHQFIVPYLYFLFILWLPIEINHVLLMLLAMAIALVVDYSSGNLGLHAAPCVLVAYLRPFILSMVIQLEGEELNYSEPCIKGMGLLMYVIYVVVMTLIHHASLVLIEWLQFGDFLYYIGKVLGITLISLLMIAVLEMFFYKRGWRERIGGTNK